MNLGLFGIFIGAMRLLFDSLTLIIIFQWLLLLSLVFIDYVLISRFVKNYKKR